MASILIIDDDTDIRKALISLLDKHGFEVFQASDGQRGMQIMDKEQIDIVITDILMPNKDGIETILEMQWKYPGVMIIAMSGGGRIDGDEYLKVAKQFGAKRTITKPIEAKEILTAVNELISNGD